MGVCFVSHYSFFVLVQLGDSYYPSQSPTHYRKDDGLQFNTGFSELAPISDFHRRSIFYTLKLMFFYSQLVSLGEGWARDGKMLEE